MNRETELLELAAGYRHDTIWFSKNHVVKATIFPPIFFRAYMIGNLHSLCFFFRSFRFTRLALTTTWLNHINIYNIYFHVMIVSYICIYIYIYTYLSHSIQYSNHKICWMFSFEALEVAKDAKWKLESPGVSRRSDYVCTVQEALCAIV